MKKTKKYSKPEITVIKLDNESNVMVLLSSNYNSQNIAVHNAGEYSGVNVVDF